MDELNKGYEFTKAQIAELESLRAENAMLKSSGIDKVVKIIAETEVWKECETLRARLAELEKQEPVAWEITVGKWIGGDRYINDTALSKHHRPGAKPLYTAPVVSPDVEKLKNRSDFREMREMLRAMQAGELTVSRGVEILNMWAAGNWNDNMLPLVRHDLIEEDSMPVEIIDRLKTELEAARKDAGFGKDDIDYPLDVFNLLIFGNSPYAFYLFQWVPYQTDARKWRLKMLHDVKTFDGREAFGIWPNGSSCGPFKDNEVEFIRISKKQFGAEWIDPRKSPEEVIEQAKGAKHA